MTKSKRSQAARIAANDRWAKEKDRSAATQPARDAMYRKFEDQVDPDRVLSPDERARRVVNARSAHYARIARKSAEVRRAKKTAATPEEYGRRLAEQAPPITDEQAWAAARIFASMEGVVPRRAGDRAAGRVPHVTRSGPVAAGPGMKKAPGVAAPEAQVPKGKNMSDTEGTTPAPASATNPDLFEFARPAELDETAWQWIQRQAARLMESQIEQVARQRRETERLEREGCGTFSWCTVQTGGEHEQFHAGELVQLTGWWCHPSQTRGGGPIINFETDDGQQEAEVLAGDVLAVLEATSSKDAYTALRELARTLVREAEGVVE